MNRRTTRLASTSCLRQQWLRDVWLRLSVVLMLVMLTTVTAWAQGTTMTVTAEDVTATYDGYEHYITVNVNIPESGATITYCETKNGTYTSTNPTYTNAGVNTVYYKVTASGYADYSGSATVTINKATPSSDIPPTASAISYGERLANSTVSGHPRDVNGAELSGTWAWADSNTMPNVSDSGKTGYSVDFTPTDTENYNSFTTTTTLTINKAPLTVTANDKNINYGDEPVNNGVTYDGFVNDEKKDVLSGELDYNYSYNQYDPVGTYQITPNGLTAANYDITFASGTLTVDPKALTVKADAKTKTYGDADPELTYTSSGLVGSDAFSGALTREEGEAVGTYAIGQGTLTAGGNYNLSYTPANLTIDPKEVTVTANDITIDHGAAAPTYTYSVTGLLGDDALDTAPTLSSTYTQGAAIGTYPISISGAAASDNYAISYAPGTLTVQSKKYTVTFQNEDGTPLQSSEVEWGETPAYAGETPTKDADAQYTYEFAGWTPNIAEVTEDATYTATYSSSPVSYNITYVLYGGTNNENNPATYTCESADITLDEPTAPANSGYTFDGWYTDANFENKVNGTAIPQNSTGNKTFYAKWLTTVTATVVWSDENNTEGFRPESVTVKLMNGEEIGSVSLNASNNWSYTWTGLPTHKGGEAITYTVTEDAVDNYSTTIEGFTITNSRTVEMTTATLNIIWQDGTNKYGVRPASLNAKLSDGTNETPYTINENLLNGNYFSFIVYDLQKYINGTEIVYSLTITDKIDCYEQTGLDKNGNTTSYTMHLMTMGNCGQTGSENALIWEYNTGEKTIYIIGTGPMMYYNSVPNDDQSYSNGAPWKAFAGEIESVIIENGVTSVGSNTFAHCPHISSVTLPTDQQLYEIGPGAFGDCTGLTSIDLPMSVNKIDDGAFAGCSNLKTVTLHYGDATHVVTIGKDVFPVTTTIIVPDAAYNAYMNAATWNGTAIGEDENKTDYTRLLAPAVITLDGNTSGWTTYCHKYSVSYSVEGGAAYTVSGINNSSVQTAAVENVDPYTPTLVYKENGGEVTLTAVAETATQSVPTNYNATTGLVTQDGDGFTFVGATTKPVEDCITDGQSYALYGGEFLKIDDKSLAIPAHRCILTLDEPNSAPRLSIVDGTQTTSLSLTPDPSPKGEGSGYWYSLDGRKLQGKPTKKGLYIYKGKKVVIK